MREPRAIGLDPILRSEIAFGIGYEVQTRDLRFGPPADAFGHSGAGGSVHGAWPSLRTGFSYAPNLLRSFSSVDSRAARLVHGLYSAVVERPRRGRRRPD